MFSVDLEVQFLVGEAADPPGRLAFVLEHTHGHGSSVDAQRRINELQQPLARLSSSRKDPEAQSVSRLKGISTTRMAPS